MYVVDQLNQELKFIYLHYMQFAYLEEQGRAVEVKSYLSFLLCERKVCILRSKCTFKFLSDKDKGTHNLYFPQSDFGHWKVSVAIYSVNCSLSATILILKSFGKTSKQLTYSSSLSLNIFFSSIPLHNNNK